MLVCAGIPGIVSTHVEFGGTHKSVFTSSAGEAPVLSCLDEVDTGRDDWNGCDCGSKERAMWHWRLMIVSHVGVCFGQKRPRSFVVRQNHIAALHEPRLDILPLD